MLGGPMGFTDIELCKIKSEMNDFIRKRRPPESIRSQVDLAYKIEKQDVIIYELRITYQRNGMVENPIAKARYVLKDAKWKIFWQRADLKWHLYEPNKEVKTIKAFIKIVDDDEYGCFWG
jgi:hypothetical protein